MLGNGRWLRYASGSGFDSWVLFIGSLVLVLLLALLRQSSERPRKRTGKENKMRGKHTLTHGNRNAKSTIRSFGSYLKETVWAGGAGLLATPLAS